MNVHVNLMDPADLAAATRQEAPEDTGVGCLRTERGNLPLDEIDVKAAITGLATRVDLTQGFRNTYAEPLEATYIFPMPPRSAVTAMRMEADGRVVDGVLKERGEAREDYDRAITEGKRASIAEEERPGVFTMRVGNIMPGERVTVRLTLAGRLPYEDGAATFRFPLVVGPRYIPGTPLSDGQVGDGTEPDTDAVPDASRISPPVLLPGFPNPVRLSIGVDIDTTGLPLAGIESSLHTAVTEERDEGLHVRLNPGERADRDFILRLRLGSDDAVAASLAVLPDDKGGTFALTVLPPSTSPVEPRPKDVVLVLDRSGSMGGWKMVAARRAAARIVDTLTSADRFAVLAFDHVVETPPALPDGLVEATDRNRFRAVEHLGGLDARGGTEMLVPLQRAAGLLAETDGRDRVLVLVTDGQIGNEDQILRELSARLSGVRVHTVGIDRLVNEAFLQRLAGLTGGRCELVESEDRLDEAMQHIHRRIATPLVTGLRVMPVGMLAVDQDSLVPRPLPDLFAGAPVVISGRFTGAPAGAVTVSGDGGWQTTVAATLTGNDSLGVVWARARVRDLEDRYVIGQQADAASLEREIVDTSLRYGVLSRFTAFVAIDQRVVNEGGGVHRITQPVEHPSGWDLPAPAPFASPMRGAAPVAAAGSMRTFAAPLRARRESYDHGALVADESTVADSLVGPAPAIPTPPATTVPEFAAEELRRLRAVTDRGIRVRADLLAALADRIRQHAGLWAQTSEPAEARTALEDLAVELLAPTSDPGEVGRRWEHAISVLEKLAGERPGRTRRAFWKR